MMKHRRFHNKGARLGQHFLTNPGIAVNIAAAGAVRKSDTVLEVGPGKGILTAALLTKGARVVAVEKDSAMVAILRERFAHEIESGQLALVSQDIRDFVQGRNLRKKYKVVANIPYYITGELIRMFLTAKHQPTTIVFLVQKEVATRIAREKKESILSLSVKAYGSPKYVATVKAGSFSPPPSVDSAILAIEKISRKNLKGVSEDVFFKVVKAGFAQKRKTLGGNLKKVFGESARSALAATGISEKIRAEDVPLSKWLSLAGTIYSPETPALPPK